MTPEEKAANEKILRELAEETERTIEARILRDRRRAFIAGVAIIGTAIPWGYKFEHPWLVCAGCIFLIMLGLLFIALATEGMDNMPFFKKPEKPKAPEEHRW